MDTSELVKEFDMLVSDRQVVEQMWTLLEKYVVPYKGNFYEDISSEEQIQWHNPHLFDSTAIIANNILSSSMQTAVTNPSIRWARLNYSDAELNDNGTAMEWLQESEDRLFGALGQSNFNLEVSEFYNDLSGFGTASMSEEINASPGPDDEFLHFDTIPIKEWYFVEDWRGRPLRAYRMFMWSPNQMASKFGKDNIPEDMKARLDNPTVANRKVKVVQAIVKRNHIKEANTFEKLAPNKRPYGGMYILHSDKTVIGKEMGYYEMPVFMTRWNKTSGSQWGFCPGMVAMPDILTLNGLAEATLEACGKVVDPASIVTERGLLSDLNLERGGLTVVRSIDDIKTYESGARFDVGELKINNLQRSINRAFHVDQLELKDSPSMTATEANIRYELMQRLLGPTLGRLENDFLDPLLTRTFRAMYREGLMPPMPEELQDRNAEMLIEYVGPLPMSQKSPIVNSVREWVSDIVALKEIRPDIDDVVNYDEMAIGIGTIKGVPARFMNDAEERAVQRQARAEQEARQQKLAELQAQGDAMKSVGEGQQAVDEADAQQ